ncbi:MFS transporter [Caldanaerobacter subterraneus]|uniref:MFS transporter n=1 Tax=Caldanaerobacter subterraneus TaxID=911092 RepID=A0A4V2S6B1_9THEO|nr:MFS transporter [Caldanaerobacter subterraneus]TCO55340.1 MFS transporter [Caldanaerobacter subterraneus]
MENREEKNNENNNIKVLGWVAFFGGLSQDMIVPILPTFYTQILGLSKEMVGLIEGSVTTVVSIMRIISGIISDKIGKRKSIVFIGYLFSAVGRVLLPLTNGAAMAFGLRLIDGIGKGTKDAPRDALIAKSSKMKSMGFSFGFQRMLDTLGSFLGPLITAGLMILFANYMDSIRYRLIFLIAGLVAFITIILIGLFVVEQKGERVSSSFKLDLSVFKGKFLTFFVVMLVFTLGNSSDAFLILRARSVGVEESTIPIIIAMFNLSYALLSVPSGVLSDRIGRVNVIRLGWIIYAVTYLGFALAKLPWHIWALYLIYGAFL